MERVSKPRLCGSVRETWWTSDSRKQLDEETRKTLDRGRRVREILKQRQYDPIPVPEQIAVLLAVTSGVFVDILIEVIESKKIDQGEIQEKAS